MVAVPRAIVVEGDEEQVVGPDPFEHRGAVGPARESVARGAAQPVQDCRTQQELPHRGGLTVEHLVGEVVEDEAVAAREVPDEVVGLATTRPATQGQGHQLQTGDPALRPPLEGIHVVGVQGQPHRHDQEVLRLGPGEAQVGRTQLDELAVRAQPRQCERRVGAGREDQVQPRGEVVHEEGDRLVHLRGAHEVEVVQHQHPHGARPEAVGTDHGVDHGGGGRRRVTLLRQGRPVDRDVQARQRGRQQSEEGGEIVVLVAKAHPPDPDRRLPPRQLRRPVREQARLAETRRRGHQRQAMTALERAVQPRCQPWARDQPRAPRRHEQLRREDGGRHPSSIGLAVGGRRGPRCAGI